MRAPPTSNALHATLLAFLGAFIGALLGGCSACETVDCGANAELPPYEFSRTRIAEDFRKFPEWSEYEFQQRPELLAEYGRNFAEGRRIEFDRTSDRVVNLPGTIAEDFSHHGGALVGTLDRAASRAGEDTCCFFARAWHTIRQALE